MEGKILNYDKALTMVGGENRYQIQLSANLAIQWIWISFVYMSATFWLQPPEFYCSDGKVCNQDKAVKENRCLDQFIVQKGEYTTITVDLGLYCDKSQILPWAQSIIFLGSALGSLLVPQISDAIGRKYPILILQFCGGLFLLGIVFSQNIAMFMIFYFLFGFCIWPVETIMYAHINESVNGKLRERALIGCMMFWSLGEVFIAGIAYWIPNWRYAMGFTMVIPYLIFAIPNFFMVFESPMFFLQRSNQKCIKALNKIAKFNNKPLLSYENLTIQADELDQQSTQSEGENKSISQYESLESITDKKQSLLDEGDKNEKRKLNKKYYLHDLFKYASLRKIVASSSMVIGGLCVLYFGSSLSLSSLSSDVYTSMIVVGVCETVSNFACSFFINRLPRKKSLIYFSLITIIITSTFIFFKYSTNSDDIPKIQTIVQLALCGIIRVFNIFCLAIYAIYILEVLPTPVRSMATGVTYAFSSVLTLLAPFAIELAQKIGVYPIFILGLIGGVFVLPLFFFTETKGKPIKEYIEEEINQPND